MDPLTYATASDEDLLSESAFTPGAFEPIVERYQEAFVRRAERIIRSREEAEDIVQETFTKIYVNARRFHPQPGASFKSWAYRILLNTTFSHYKRLKRAGEFFAELDPEILELVPDLVSRTHEKDTIRDQVASVLSRMPSKLSRALEGFFLEDRPQQEMADEEGVGVGVIKTRVLRGKREFKKIIQEQGLS